MKYQLVIVTSKTCKFCVEYKRKHNSKVISGVRRMGDVEILELTVGTPQFKDTVKKHGDLVDFISWYPTFILFTMDSWNGNKLNGVVYCGKLVGDNISFDNTLKFDPKYTNMVDWVIKSKSVLESKSQLPFEDDEVVYEPGYSSVVIDNDY